MADDGPNTLLFRCAICRHDIRDYPWRNGRDRHIEPLCRCCEGAYADAAPKDGAQMDRRIARQISSLANILLSEAGLKAWEVRNGNSRL